MQADRIDRVGIVGAGLIGHGIALDFALAGCDVFLHSRSQESLDRALAKIQGDLKMLVELGAVSQESTASVISRIHAYTAIEEAVGDVPIVIEAVYEDLALKQQVFGRLDSLCPDEAILVSGTSTLRLSDLASVTTRPDRVVLANYCNPPFLMPVVEIVRNKATAEDVVVTLVNLLTGMGKRPVVIQQDVPGFLGNRLQAALLREALWLVQKGVVTAQDVDTTLRYGLARRWAAAGIFEVFDVAGWDLLSAGVSELFPNLEASPEVPPLLHWKVEKGELGEKTGKGFYEWGPGTAEECRRRIARMLVEIEKLATNTEP